MGTPADHAARVYLVMHKSQSSVLIPLREQLLLWL